MFLLGVFWGADKAPSAMVLLEQTWANLRRCYRLESLRAPLPDRRFDELAERLRTIFEDRRYAVYKRVFSQDRRPAKRLQVKPRIVLAAAGAATDVVDALRVRQLPVECVIRRDQNGWEKYDYDRICLGHNYRVNREILVECLATVARENRLHFPAGDLERLMPVAALRTADLPDSGCPTGGACLALAAAVWFSETVKSLKRYGQAG